MIPTVFDCNHIVLYFVFVFVFFLLFHVVGLFHCDWDPFRRSWNVQMAFWQNRSISLVDMYIDNSEPTENVGQIHFSLEYDFQNTTLILKIMQVSPISVFVFCFFYVFLFPGWSFFFYCPFSKKNFIKMMEFVTGMPSMARKLLVFSFIYLPIGRL